VSYAGVQIVRASELAARVVQRLDELRNPNTSETLNRDMRPQHVDAYAEEMPAGRWRDSSDPISITADGHVLNGQHRLAAASKVDWANVENDPSFLVATSQREPTLIPAGPTPPLPGGEGVAPPRELDRARSPTWGARDSTRTPLNHCLHPEQQNPERKAPNAEDHHPGRHRTHRGWK
jgi:hypothetical protein